MGDLSKPRNAEIETALNWLDAALRCEGFLWDVDQREAATMDLAAAREAASRLQAPAVAEWQPMDTAPKDGKHCILSVPEPSGFIYSVQGAFQEGRWNAAHRDNVEPIAWMPNVASGACSLRCTARPGAWSNAATTRVGTSRNQRSRRLSNPSLPASIRIMRMPRFCASRIRLGRKPPQTQIRMSGRQ